MDWTGELMHAEGWSKPFSRPGWLFEIKHDGFRVLAMKERGRVRLHYRRGSDATRSFPDVAAALEEIRAPDFVLDAELVVLEADGRSAFHRLQQRFRLTRPGDVGPAAAAHPASLLAFDVLSARGRDLRALPLIERKRILRELLPPRCPVRYVDHVEERGEAVFREARRLGLEGVMAKRADAPYKAGRATAWVKIPIHHSDEFVIVGFTRPGLGREGGLHVATRRRGKLVYAGRVGTGLTADGIAQARELLGAHRVSAPPCSGAPRGDHTWVQPLVVCEVRYREITPGGLLRHPAFLRFRPDKSA